MPEMIGDAEQDAHQAKEELARQACEHVRVQLEHDVGEAAGDVRRVQIGTRMQRPSGSAGSWSDRT